MTKYYQWHLQGGKEEKPVTIISFTVTGRRGASVTCQAEEGMTWAEFVDSSYNPIRSNYRIFSISGNRITAFLGMGLYVSSVEPSDTIIANHEYTAN